MSDATNTGSHEHAGCLCNHRPPDRSWIMVTIVAVFCVFMVVMIAFDEQDKRAIESKLAIECVKAGKTWNRTMGHAECRQ